MSCTATSTDAERAVATAFAALRTAAIAACEHPDDPVRTTAYDRARVVAMDAIVTDMITCDNVFYWCATLNVLQMLCSDRETVLRAVSDDPDIMRATVQHHIAESDARERELAQERARVAHARFIAIANSPLIADVGAREHDVDTSKTHVRVAAVACFFCVCTR